MLSLFFGWGAGAQTEEKYKRKAIDIRIFLLKVIFQTLKEMFDEGLHVA